MGRNRKATKTTQYTGGALGIKMWTKEDKNGNSEDVKLLHYTPAGGVPFGKGRSLARLVADCLDLGFTDPKALVGWVNEVCPVSAARIVDILSATDDTPHADGGVTVDLKPITKDKAAAPVDTKDAENRVAGFLG